MLLLALLICSESRDKVTDWRAWSTRSESEAGHGPISLWDFLRAGLGAVYASAITLRWQPRRAVMLDSLRATSLRSARRCEHLEIRR